VLYTTLISQSNHISCSFWVLHHFTVRKLATRFVSQIHSKVPNLFPQSTSSVAVFILMPHDKNGKNLNYLSLVNQFFLHVCPSLCDWNIGIASDLPKTPETLTCNCLQRRRIALFTCSTGQISRRVGSFWNATKTHCIQKVYLESVSNLWIILNFMPASHTKSVRGKVREKFTESNIVEDCQHPPNA